MESWQVYAYARKTLTPGALQAIYRRSIPLVYGWAAPPTNEIHLRNPIDRIIIMLKELDAAGRDDVARAAIDLMAEPLGGRFEPISKAASDKGSVDGEAADAVVALGKFVEICRKSLKDGHVTKKELGLILEALREVRRELDEIFDVINRSIQTSKDMS